jgi:TolB-like protein/DNA-binding winged helix-turn-helix (wHTH) protein/Tfp pilus assembly protein PilF
MTGLSFYEFGRFRLDARGRLLFREGRIVPLPPKVADLLLLLVEKAGRVVEKDELLQRIWPDTFVEEGSLTRTISILRRALGDGSEGGEFITTIPKRGYRFVAAVRQIQDVSAAPVTGNEESLPPQVSAPQASPMPVSTRPLGRRRAAAMVVVTLTAGLLLTAYLARQRFWPQPSSSGRRIMLAVLPVQNLTGDSEQEFVSDGLTEEMITQLGSLNAERLGVIARTSSMTYKGSRKRIDQIGRELGVDYILEGSLRWTGDHLRITAQLIRVRDQSHVWAHEYDPVPGNIVKVQDEVAQAIADAIQIKLTPQQQARMANARPINPEAYQAYVKGRYFWNKRTEQGLKKGMEYFQQAIDLDPQYALAYAGLADCNTLLSVYSNALPTESFPRAEAAAVKALEIDATLAEAHASLGFSRLWYDWDWSGAEREYQRAIELNPNYATAHQGYGEYLRMMGRQDEALAESKRALELDPLSLIIVAEAGMPFYYERRYDEAIKQFQKALELDPKFAPAHDFLGLAYEGEGKYEQALVEYQLALGSGGAPRILGNIGAVYAKIGKRGGAQKILEHLKNQTEPSGYRSLEVAVINASLGEKDQAFEWLEKAYKERAWLMITLKVEPGWDSLRKDSRFQDLVRRVGLAP